MPNQDLSYYQRNLPHWLPPGETIFLTFRLAGTLPRAVLEQLQAEWEAQDQQSSHDESRYTRQKRYFGRFDGLLDGAATGPSWLRNPAVAQLVQQALHHYNGTHYQLVCYCLMPNHVHAVVGLPDEAPPLARTLQYLKGYTAQKANALLARSGRFWHRESYDHLVRNPDELARIVAYVLENPVKAGLVKDWQAWPYTYLTP